MLANKNEEHDSTKLPRNSGAPGQPGVKPSWSSGAKTAVGTALSTQSRIWFTIGSGIVNEIYFPDVDCANTRGIKFLVTDGKHFFSDEEQDAAHKVRWIESGIPGVWKESRCKKAQYVIETEVIAHPDRDVLYLDVVFRPAVQQPKFHLYLFCNPHMGDQGAENDAWVGQYKGVPMLFAQRNGLSLAAACSDGFTTASCGYVGKSDGLTELRRTKRLTKFYTEAMRGNVAWIAEIDWLKCNGRFRIAIAAGGHPAEAGLQARSGLLQDFAAVRRKYVSQWETEQARFSDLSKISRNYATSFAILRTHESKRFPGGFIASLSVPWGFDRGDKDTGGYHVLWPRDLGETSLGLLAAGDVESTVRSLEYLKSTQNQDGSWSQNMWLDGTPHWTAIQMDGIGFPILIADALRRRGRLSPESAWRMVKAAAAFLLRMGPCTDQDRWESNAGYSPYTMAVEIAALLAAADFADAVAEPDAADFLRSTADAWNEAIDELTYISGTKLAKKHAVDGYYIRIMPPDGMQAKSLWDVPIQIKNHPKGWRKHRAADIVSADALALVRFGLRSATDQRILNTVKVVDAVLKTETAIGPAWHRYTDDGYGEQSDGSPFKKTGQGRGWPLLAGERAHYEIAKGDFERADGLRKVMEAQTSECGLIPEQVWDSHDIPKRQLFNGHPTGSGMPLVWAHAEYVKLLRSLKDRQVWDMPPQTAQRYVTEKRTSGCQIWTEEEQRTTVSPGKNLRIHSTVSHSLEWSSDGGKTKHKLHLADSGLGIGWAELPCAGALPGTRIQVQLLPKGPKFSLVIE